MLQTDLPIPYLIKPSEVEADKTKLMILIHGYGSNEEDLFSFAPYLPKDFTILSVRGIHETMMGGYSWYDINFTDSEKFNNVEQANQSISLLKEFSIQALEKFNITEKNVWLCGFSQGAILNYALTLRNPQLYQHTICLSGYFSPDILGSWVEKDYSTCDFFISHGKEDMVIPVEWARRGPEILTAHLIKNVYYEYNSGHGVTPENFNDMDNWIKERI